MTNNSGIFKNVEQDYPDYISDESRHAGEADSISFPVTEQDLIEQLVFAGKSGIPVTVQGARTGIAGGAVPESGHIINLSRMKKIDTPYKRSEKDVYFVKTQPGALLSEIRDRVKQETGGSFFFPPDPTETSASIGGIVASNASGACSFRYGSTRNYVERLRIILLNGSSRDYVLFC
jgi:D-lactate dehydrogenase (cytochrome)